MISFEQAPKDIFFLTDLIRYIIQNFINPQQYKFEKIVDSSAAWQQGNISLTLSAILSATSKKRIQNAQFLSEKEKASSRTPFPFPIFSSSKQGKSFFLIRFFCHRSYLITCFFDGCFQFFMIQRFFRGDLCLFLSVRRAYFLDWKCISHRFVHMTFSHAAHHAVHANDCLYHFVSFFLSDLFFTFTECFPPDIPGLPPLFSEPHLLLLSPCIPLQFLFHG